MLMLKREIDINPKLYYFIKITLIVLIFLIIYRYFFHSELENFNIEGEQNLLSVFNPDNLIVGDLVVNQSFNMIPRGSVVAWTKDTIPKGWAICDGTNGTPDLRGRFIVGTGQGDGLTLRNLGSYGGEENHVLTSDEIPSHGHSTTIYGGFTAIRAAAATSSHCTTTLNDENSPFNLSSNPIDSNNNNQEITTAAHNNMPPFYVLYYIMKL